MPPDEYRSKGTPSPSEAPYARGETFWFLLWRLTKGTRRKGETIICHYRSNGYTPKPQEHGRPKGRQGHTKDQRRKCPTMPFNSTPNCASSILEAAFPRIANED